MIVLKQLRGISANRHIDLTLTEACYLRMVVNDRIDYLKRRISRYERYCDHSEDPVIWEQKKACVEGELVNMQHIYSELTLFISQSVVISGLLNEFDK